MHKKNFYPFFPIEDNSSLLMGCFSFAERYLLEKDSSYTPEVFNVVDIVQKNAKAICHDIALKQLNKNIVILPNSNQFIQAHEIFIEEEVMLENCIINASEGPVFIARGCKIMDGAIIRGPVFIDEGSIVKMGATIYGGTSIGKNCVVGGEIKNSVINDFSNKAHHGYLGDSYIGKWCNLGAGTSNSNVKNTGGDVFIKLEDDKINAGNKFGLIMGDYSRCAINTSFNTGTMVGICCNIFATGLTPKYISHFSWGDAGEKYQLLKAFTDIENWKKMKGKVLTEPEKKDLEKIYFS